MRQLKNNILLLSALLFTVVVLGNTSMVIAQSTEPVTTTETTPVNTTVEEVSVCTKYDNVPLNVSLDADKRLQDDQKKQAQQDAARTLIRTNFDAKVLEIREKWEQEKQSFYEKLEGKAIIEDQKIAVKTFVTAVDSALVKRQADIDAVRKDYRKKVDALIAKKRENLTAALPIFKEAATVASVEAKNSCMQVSANIPIITSILKGQLIAAQKTYKTSVLGTESIEKELLKLQDERISEVKKIDNAFKNAEESARRELRGILGDNI